MAPQAKEQQTFLFAPEIEQSLVSMCWHEPERVALVYRELNPAVHLVQPHLRMVLEAINIAYGQLGCADWATVVQVVRESGQFEECGGLEGLNALYDCRAYGRDLARDQVIFDDYVQMLKEYALNRAQEPPRPADYFTGGKGTLYPNKVRKSPQSADFIGTAVVAGKHYEVQLWVTTDGSFVNFKLSRI
jgi:hypothetical protein